MEDDPKQYNATKKQLKVKTITFLEMEDNLNFFCKWKTTLKKMQFKTIKSKNNDCGTAPCNLVYK